LYVSIWPTENYYEQLMAMSSADVYEKLAILGEYLFDHCQIVTIWTTIFVYTTSATTDEAVLHNIHCSV